MEYKYKLEKYAGPNTKHICPQCGHKGVFTRYIDIDNRKYLADNVGRCDRESNCGYHHKPKDYLKKNNYPDKIYKVEKRIRKIEERGNIEKIRYIDGILVKESLTGYEKNI